MWSPPRKPPALLPLPSGVYLVHQLYQAFIFVKHIDSIRVVPMPVHHRGRVERHCWNTIHVVLIVRVFVVPKPTEQRDDRQEIGLRGDFAQQLSPDGTQSIVNPNRTQRCGNLKGTGRSAQPKQFSVGCSLKGQQINNSCCRSRQGCCGPQNTGCQSTNAPRSTFWMQRGR